jgi:hypothetical protein
VPGGCPDTSFKDGNDKHKNKLIKTLHLLLFSLKRTISLKQQNIIFTKIFEEKILKVFLLKVLHTMKIQSLIACLIFGLPVCGRNINLFIYVIFVGSLSCNIVFKSAKLSLCKQHKQPHGMIHANSFSLHARLPSHFCF